MDEVQKHKAIKRYVNNFAEYARRWYAKGKRMKLSLK